MEYVDPLDLAQCLTKNSLKSVIAGWCMHGFLTEKELMRSFFHHAKF